MTAQKHPLYYTIHGHFYQPPRENPWTGTIEHQPSAMPHHDWNLRIAKECYGPNSASRILDEYGRIRELVNNYEYMSFNMGPTLLSYIRFHMPEVYERIQQADRASFERLGHGTQSHRCITTSLCHSPRSKIALRRFVGAFAILNSITAVSPKPCGSRRLRSIWTPWWT